MSIIENSLTKPVLVYFYTDWCSACKFYIPQIQILEKRDDFTLTKLNADENKDIAIEHKLSRLPSCYLYKEGNLIKEYIGTVPNLDALLEDIG